MKLEVECFHTGAFWNLEFIRKQGFLKDKAYTTLFLGWPGGTWTPPTEKALIYMVDHLPRNCIWNVSVMNPQKQWDLLSLAVSLGGHVRVGYEDNPYIAPGELAQNNAVLVERMMKIAQGLGREVATPRGAADPRARTSLKIRNTAHRTSLQTSATFEIIVIGITRDGKDVGYICRENIKKLAVAHSPINRWGIDRHYPPARVDRSFYSGMRAAPFRRRARSPKLRQSRDRCRA